MTREEAKTLLPIIQAWADGKAIQVQNPVTSKWEYLDINKIGEFMEELNYRIEPEPKYRAFKSQEECWQEMHKHPDFGWVTDGYYKSTISVKSDSIVVTISSLEYDFGKAYIHFTFADGTPFGIKEE